MCDYDPPDFIWTRQPKARKQHKCQECFGTIEKGEKYQKTTSKYDGAIDTYETCLPCADLYIYANQHELPVEGTYSHTGCIYYGELHEVVRQSPELCPDELLSPKMKQIKEKALERIRRVS
jgi:hypothetical protein